jgi:two-component system response regulator MprA
MQPNEDGSPKKILIVENDAVLSNMLMHTLTQRGLRVVEARNGEDGLTQIQVTNPDLILLDIDMPKMSGLTMLKELRASGDKRPIMMLTNLNNPEYIADAAEYNVHEYLIKADWEIDEIAEKVMAKLRIANS